MDISNNTYTFLCAIPVIQTVIGITSAITNVTRIVNDIAKIVQHPEERENHTNDLSEHAWNLLEAILSTLPIIGTIYNISKLIFMKDEVVQEEVIIPSIQVTIPLEVKVTLDRLFEDSPYPIDDLPVYPTIFSKDHPSPERELMNDSVMKGMTSLGQPVIMIKLDCDLTDENLKKIIKYNKYYQDDDDGRHLQDILLLFPRLPDAPLSWEQFTGGVMNAQFFTWNFTYGEDGTGPTNSQKDNFLNFQALLRNGTAVDTQGLAWSIPDFKVL